MKTWWLCGESIIIIFAKKATAANPNGDADHFSRDVKVRLDSTSSCSSSSASPPSKYAKIFSLNPVQCCTNVGSLVFGFSL